MATPGRTGLLAWQWSLYPDGHRDRRNLAAHVATVPLFLAGTLAVPLSLAAGPWMALPGIAAMVGAMAMQGRTHRREATPPQPFLGPGDVVLRILAEQWITFPRFVFSGGFARAWRESAWSADSSRDDRSRLRR
jgi:hypothetical protein